MWVLQDYICVFNAFHAKKVGILSYKDIRVYSNILIKKLSKNGIICITSDEYSDTFTTINGRTYIKRGKDCLLFDSLDDEYINEINSIYSDEIIRLIEETNEEFAHFTLDDDQKGPYVKTRNNN